MPTRPLIPVLLVIPDHCQDIARTEPANGTGAVAGHFDCTCRPDDKACWMQELFLLLKISTEGSACFFQVQPMGYREGKPQVIDCFLRLIPGIHRSCQYIHVFRLEVLHMLLEISQLLIAERSPVAPVNQEHPVSPTEVLVNSDLTVFHCLKAHVRKSVSCVQECSL